MLGVGGGVVLTIPNGSIRAWSKAKHSYAAAAAVPSVEVVIAGIEFALSVVRDMLVFAGIVIELLPVLIMRITVVVLAVLVRSMVAALVVFWSDGISGVSCRVIPYERGGGVAACACVIRLQCHAGVCSIQRELGRAFEFHTCTLDIIYHNGS